METDAALEFQQVGRAEGVGLCDDRNEVDTCAQALHDLNVEGLQSVAGGTDEVQAGVDAEVDFLHAARLLLLEHVALVLVVEKLDDGLP